MSIRKMMKKMSKKCPGHKKNMFQTLLGSKMGFPPAPPLTARTTRPIFDGKKYSKNICFNVQDNLLTFPLTIS